MSVALIPLMISSGRALNHNRSPIMNRSISLIAACFVLTAFAPSAFATETAAGGVIAAAPATAAACPGESMSFLQRRVLQKADQGVDALRQYIWITRAMYQLDIVETVAWIERHRAAQAGCAGTKTASAS
jgi:hypothetical protein